MLFRKHPLAKTFWRLVRGFLQSPDRYLAIGIFVGLIILMTLSVYFTVIVNQWYASFFDAVQQKNTPAFYTHIFAMVYNVGCMLALFISTSFLSAFLSFRWRQWQTQYFLKGWLSQQTYYHMMNRTHPIDNPDQRISQDLNNFSTLSITLVFDFFHEFLCVVCFIGILWGLSKGLIITLFDIPYTFHGYLVWGALGYAILGSGLMHLIGKKLINLDVEQEQKEANFRYRLVRLRENRESIALFQAENFEQRSLFDAFLGVTKNYYKILKCKVYIDLIQNVYLKRTAIFTGVIAAPMYFNGALSFGEFMQVPGAFAAVLTACSVFITNYKELAAWTASLKRIHELEQHMNTPIEHPPHTVAMHQQNSSALQYDFKAINKPSGEPILEHPFQLTVHPKERVLLLGNSGTGKSTLARLTAGLWPYAEGTLLVPSEPVFILPQKPYLPFENLYQCLVYPHTQNAHTTAAVIAQLEALDLAYLIPHLETEQDWSNQLSLGEQQRIGFIRLFLTKPKVALLDEPTSALSAAQEKQLFEMLFQYCPEITLLTIGHTQSLAAYHHRIVRLDHTAASATTDAVPA